MNIRVITHNIRYATTRPFPGEEKWPIRCPRLCSELIFNSASIPTTFICLQEVLDVQLTDILSALNTSHSEKEWDYIGVGREDGIDAGEYSPILYRSSEWKLIQWQTKWLSPTPDKPSKGWDASSTRIVTIGRFEHRDTGKNLLVLNTHLDDQGVKSRQESAKLILQFIETLSKTSNPAAILLAGDFNSPPDDGAYQIMTDPKTGMEDVGIEISKERRYGNEITFTSFGHIDNTPSRIDFIFSRAQHDLEYLTYAVLANRFDDGVYLSDHRACVADLQLL
ncbi:Endonuclease/exonuclease/phosphatase [Tricladium varicosporioides]|nr:Endonuclease/exonuclease/phosphatase [Hymenoscyphus varicosporioides]